MFFYLERFGALVALVGIAISAYAYVRGGEGQLLSGYFMFAGVVLFVGGVIGERIQKGLKRK